MKIFFPTTAIATTLLLSLSLSAAPKKAPAKAPPAKAAPRPTSVDGTYEGTMVMRDSGVKIPVAFALQLTEDELPTNPDEPFSTKKGISGNFVIDGEEGPFALATSDFEVNRGVFNLKYNKTGSASGQASLRFQCSRKANGSCSGTVISSSVGIIADFYMYKSAKSILRPIPKYVGVWKGKLKFSTLARQIMATLPTMPGAPKFEDEEAFTFTLAPGDGNNTTNPATFELESTPKRLGSFWYDKTPMNQLPFATVQIDYFHRLATLTYTNTSGAQTMQFTLSGKFDSTGNFTAESCSNPVEPCAVTSTSFGNTGTFTAEKMP